MNCSSRNGCENSQLNVFAMLRRMHKHARRMDSFAAGTLEHCTLDGNGDDGMRSAKLARAGVSSSKECFQKLFIIIIIDIMTHLSRERLNCNRQRYFIN